MVVCELTIQRHSRDRAVFFCSEATVEYALYLSNMDVKYRFLFFAAKVDNSLSIFSPYCSRVLLCCTSVVFLNLVNS